MAEIEEEKTIIFDILKRMMNKMICADEEEQKNSSDSIYDPHSLDDRFCLDPRY